MGKKPKDEPGEKPQRIPLEPKMLFMTMDKKHPKYGVNFRITRIIEGNPDTLEPGEAVIEFQHQIPRGPGRPAEIHKACPYCEHPFPGGAVLSIPATRETPTANSMLRLPESQFWDLIEEHGASAVEP